MYRGLLLVGLLVAIAALLSACGASESDNDAQSDADTGATKTVKTTKTIKDSYTTNRYTAIVPSGWSLIEEEAASTGWERDFGSGAKPDLVVLLITTKKESSAKAAKARRVFSKYVPPRSIDMDGNASEWVYSEKRPKPIIRVMILTNKCGTTVILGVSANPTAATRQNEQKLTAFSNKLNRLIRPVAASLKIKCGK